MKLTIPKPCHENWENMDPDEKGRFCAVCSKTVRDFTVSSDQEIIDTISEPAEKNICGRFNESQLNRSLQYSYINSLFTKFAVGFILTTGGIISVHAQQTNIKKDTTEAVVIVGGISAPRKLNDNQPLYVLDGKIINEKRFRAIDPDQIDKINVLKSASAVAIYGEKGKNGVILITTKKKKSN